MFANLKASLSPPHMSWLQLAAATVFVITVALAWRQVTLFIMREI